MFNSIKNEKGVVLVIALMILALLTVLSLTAVLTTTTDMEISTNYKISQTTFYNNEGGMDIAPGVIRRILDIQSPFPPPDINGVNDGDGISDADEDTTVFKSVTGFANDLTDNDNGNLVSDFAEVIRGEIAGPRSFTVTVNANDITASTTRIGARTLTGYSTGYATGYEGGAMTGKGIYFSMVGTGSGDKNSQSQIELQYCCVERTGGGCL